MPRIKTLIAAADAAFADFLRSLVITVNGFSVTAIAGVPADILALLKEQDINLVILDDKLPGLSSAEIIARARKGRNPLDFIILAEACDALTVSAMLRLGVMDYIIKPFTAKRILASLTSYHDLITGFSRKKAFTQDDLDRWYKPKSPSP